MRKKNIKVAVGMSGGVDSSVAAAILKKQGYQVIGIFMHFWAEPDNKENQKSFNKCCSVEAQNDARRVADILDIPLYTINLDINFKKDIVDDFVSQYEQGLTPNPCVRCNQFIKFGYFLEKAKALGCDYIATGHYVRLKKDRQGYHLKEAKDPAKDQTYFLHRLNQKVLAHCLFPIGDYKKDKVRKMAAKFKLPVFNKRDSQEICFVPAKDHYSFLQKYATFMPGDIITPDNQIIGQHQGLPLYTIGQRKGIELNNGPWYVADMDFANNKLIVTNDPQHPSLYNDIMYLSEVVWLNKEIKLPAKLEIRIRYMHKNQQGTLSKINNNLYQVKFKTKQRAVTPGQYAVFYKNREVLGGGKIIKNTN